MFEILRLLILESWKGQRPLWKVFWLYYVLGAVPVGLSLGLFVEFAKVFPSAIALVLNFAVLAFVLAWKIWALVSIWRCAPNSSTYDRKFLGRAYVVLFLLSVPLSVSHNIVKFRDYRVRGYDAVVKAQIGNAAVAQEDFYNKAQTYTDDPTNLYGQYLTHDPAVRLAILPGKGGFEKSFLIVGRHSESEKAFFFESISGKLNETTMQDVREAGVKGIYP